MTQPGSTRKQEIRALLQSKQPTKAKQLCQNEGQGSADPELLALLANAHLRLGEIDAAVATGRQAIAKGWADPFTVVMVVALLVHQGKTEEAGLHFSGLARYGLQVAEAECQVANLLAQIGDFTNAIAAYRRVIAHCPGDASVYFDLALVLQQAGRHGEAVECCEKSLQLNVGFAPAFCRLGISLAAMKQYDGAVRALERAVQLDPVNSLAQFHLGEAYQLQKRYPLAIACYRRAIEVNPGEPALHGSLGRALRNLGDIESAIDCQRHTLKLDPCNAVAWHETGICCYDDRNVHASREAFARAVQLNPGLAQSWFFLGMIHDQCGEAGRAREYFNRACSLWPYLACFVDSWRYASEHEEDVRYFSTGRQIFGHAVANAGSEGQFLEFGVYNGASINVIARLAGNTVHGFDTFQGLPADWKIGEGDQVEIEPAGSYSTHGQLPEAPANVVFHVGTFEDTLPPFCAENPDAVSFMNVDCDLYSSTQSIFHHLGSQIQPGTVIVFDDYFCLPGWREHEYRAFQEFLAEHGLDYEYLAFNLFAGQAVLRITNK